MPDGAVVETTTLTIVAYVNAVPSDILENCWQGKLPFWWEKTFDIEQHYKDVLDHTNIRLS